MVNGTNYTTLESADTHSNWTASDTSLLTVADGDVTRDINFYEDEDESTSGNLTKLAVGANDNTYAQARISSTDLTNYDYITVWVRASEIGNMFKLGFGETTATEHEETFNIESADEWQKIYWDISKIADHERNEVRHLRVTAPSNTYTMYFDNITADRYLTTTEGSKITSTPDDFIQYRAVLTGAKNGYTPKLHNVQVEWTDGYKIEQTDTNTVRLYNYTGETQNIRLEAIVFGADLAEWYTVNDNSIEPGDMVSLTGTVDDYGVPILTKSTGNSDTNLVGAISTKAGKTLGMEAENRRLLALAGRIPVKIDRASEPILAGDSITSGPTKGLAKKADIGERAIGRALEDWNHESEKDTVLVLVAPGYTHGTDVTADKVEALEQEVGVITSLLDTDGISGLAETFSEFKTYADGLGLNVTTNEQGESLLAVSTDFAVTGSTSLGDTTVTGELNVGGISVNPTENSLNVLGASCINADLDVHNSTLCEAQTLYIQKNLTGNVNLFNGAIVMEPNGRIKAFEIDVTKVTTEEIEITSDESVGTAIIKAGDIYIYVQSSVVDPESLIFVSPASNIGNTQLYTGEKYPSEGFEVWLTNPTDTDVEFNWWVVKH